MSSLLSAPSKPPILNTVVGLTNLGNTCFLNSALQALLRCSPLVAHFLTQDVAVREGSNKKEMVSAFHTLVRDFWGVVPKANQRPSLAPGGFLASMYKVLHEADEDWHSRGRQSDASEAITKLLEYLHDAMYYTVSMGTKGVAVTNSHSSQVKAIDSWRRFFEKEYSPIVRNFYGLTRSAVTCDVCGTCSESFEPFLTLKAPIPGAELEGGTVPTLSMCLKEAFHAEEIPDYDCATCKKKGKATKQETLTHLPPVLLLSLKRFVRIPTARGEESRKVRGKVEWDLEETDFSAHQSFIRDPITGLKGDDLREASKYTTVAVIEHSGTMEFGHYEMYSRSENSWIHCNDSSVVDVRSDAVITKDSYVVVMVPKHARAEMEATAIAAIQKLRASQTPVEVAKEA